MLYNRAPAGVAGVASRNIRLPHERIRVVAGHGNVVKDPLDAIIEQFNEQWFSGWEATPEDQRIVLLQLIQKIKEHPDYQSKFADNKDRQNRDLTFKKILDDVMLKKRRQDADLYKLYSKDEGFYRAFFDTMKRLSEMDLPDAG